MAGGAPLFHKWLARSVEEYGFDEPEDFRTIVSKTRGCPRKEYLLTLDTAKELSMVERTERGRAARRCFIQMQKAAREMAAQLVAEGWPEAIPQSLHDALADTHKDHACACQ